MSFFDVFKNTWTAKQMSDDDRRKLFWHLKRASSYSAWQALSDAFDRFAEVYERQVKEEPRVGVYWDDGTFWGTDWEFSYPNILRGQVFFEKGLSRLRTGDRTVWRYNEQGILVDADNVLAHWWTVLVNHGPHHDIFMEGKYEPQIVEAMRDIGYYARATAGICQSPWADPTTQRYWSELFKDQLERELPFPPALPEVPVPDENVTVRSGKTVPCYGIYEPQVEDGCMDYLLEGAPAPKVVKGDGPWPVIWRLIWEDTRYLDGTIPDEESLYFLSREEPKAAATTGVSLDRPISRRSNEKATRPGVWVVMNRLDVKHRFAAEDTLPQHDGQDVDWLWLGKD